MLERSKNTWPVDLSKLQAYGQQRLPGCAKQEVLEVIGLPENAGVPAVALDVFDPVRPRPVLVLVIHELEQVFGHAYLARADACALGDARVVHRAGDQFNFDLNKCLLKRVKSIPPAVAEANSYWYCPQISRQLLPDLK